MNRIKIAVLSVAAVAGLSACSTRYPQSFYPDQALLVAVANEEQRQSEFAAAEAQSSTAAPTAPDASAAPPPQPQTYGGAATGADSDRSYGDQRRYEERQRK